MKARLVWHRVLTDGGNYLFRLDTPYQRNWTNGTALMNEDGTRATASYLLVMYFENSTRVSAFLADSTGGLVDFFPVAKFSSEQSSEGWVERAVREALSQLGYSW